MTMTSTWDSTSKPPVGTEVIVNPQYNTRYVGRRWTVESHRVKNVLLTPLNAPAGAKKLIIDPALLKPAPAQSDTVTSAVVETIPAYPPVYEGVVVKVAGPLWKQPADKLFVILADNTYKNNSVKIAELGGKQKGSYWPRVPRGYITVVPLGELADLLRK